VPVADLEGAREIATRLGVKHPETVHGWTRRDPSFPKPVAVISGTKVWRWTQIQRWARRTGRLTD
jgi:hypothetical protein